MKYWITTTALASASLIAVPIAVANDNTRLFQDWHYGQHIDDFPRGQGYYDCTSDLGEYALCNDDITFLERSF